MYLSTHVRCLLGGGLLAVGLDGASNGVGGALDGVASLLEGALLAVRLDAGGDLVTSGLTAGEILALREAPGRMLSTHRESDMLIDFGGLV